MKMPIFLPKELETEVFGTGEGFICIIQKDMKLLDKVKEGVPYPLHLINQALELTGDLE